MAAQTTVVIIGGSYGGLGVAHAVLKGIPDVKVVLINPSKRVYFNLAAPRILAKPHEIPAEKYLFPIPDLFKRYPSHLFEFVQGTVKSIDDAGKTVNVQGVDRSVIPYDYLVIASGSSTKATQGTGSALAPFKTTGSDDIETDIKNIQEKLSRAKSIVIAGAGPVGVEFAAEVAEAFKDKTGTSITLVSATDHVLPTLKEGAGAAAERLLQNLGVNVLISRRVKNAELDARSNKWSVVLDGDETLTADLYVSTTGVIPNNDFIPAKFLTSDGWVVVDSELRAQSSDSSEKGAIYAIGDITNLPMRLLSRIADQVSVLVTNLKADIVGQGKHSQYSGNKMTMMVVPVGKSAGTGQFGSWVPWSFVVTMIKSKNFFIPMAPSFLSAK